MWGDISLWFWFLFLWWLAMLSTSSCICWPHVCLLTLLMSNLCTSTLSVRLFLMPRVWKLHVCIMHLPLSTFSPHIPFCRLHYSLVLHVALQGLLSFTRWYFFFILSFLNIYFHTYSITIILFFNTIILNAPMPLHCSSMKNYVCDCVCDLLFDSWDVSLKFTLDYSLLIRKDHIDFLWIMSHIDCCLVNGFNNGIFEW